MAIEGFVSADKIARDQHKYLGTPRGGETARLYISEGAAPAAALVPNYVPRGRVLITPEQARALYANNEHFRQYLSRFGGVWTDKAGPEGRVALDSAGRIGWYGSHGHAHFRVASLIRQTNEPEQKP